MTFFITQCPHCSATFRTRINQLQSADGMVRCGACLKVFGADDNLVPSAELQTMIVRDPGDDILTLDLVDSIPGRITPSISEQPVWEILGEEPPTKEVPTTDEKQNPGAAAMPASDPEPFALHASSEEESAPDDYGFDAEHLATVAGADEILEPDWQQPAQRSLILWPYAALLIITLLGQFVVYEFDMLSENTRTRPWLQSACQVLGCQLPPIVDVAAIRSDNLLVHSHSQFSNALSVNMTLRNSGRYPQPFPALSLKFSNVRNETIAMRSFTPAEYLPEGLSANTPMPINTPIQVNLDIRDPGIEAVNYEVSFSPLSPR